MKVRCIDSSFMADHLTVGKEYDVIDTFEDCYVVVSDKDTEHTLLMSRFETVNPTEIEVTKMTTQQTAKEQESLSLKYKNEASVALKNYAQSVESERELWYELNKLWAEDK
jgi:hypothetical protein